MNLSAAERSAGLGDKTLSQSFWLVCAESIILRKMSSEVCYRHFVHVFYAVFKDETVGV